MLFDPVLEQIATLLSPLPITWGFCGGWAIDLALNHITRPHKDVDVAILRRGSACRFRMGAGERLVIGTGRRGPVASCLDRERFFNCPLIRSGVAILQSRLLFWKSC